MITETLARCADVYFGFRADQISSDLLAACTVNVLRLHKDMTVSDIGFAFCRAVIEKKDWRGLQANELMRPIQQWSNARRKIKLDYARFAEDQNKDAEGEIKKSKFEQESICVYRESMREFNDLISNHDVNQDGLNTRKGTKFQASAIAKKYLAHQIDQEEKNFLWQKAQDEFKRLKLKAIEAKEKKKLFTGVLEGFSNSQKQILWIYAEIIVIKSIQLGLEPKEND